MSATLNITNFFSMVSQGREISGKQGAATDDPKSPLPLTVDGLSNLQIGTLATATVATLFDSDDFPATFVYLFFWSDQDCYIQLIGSGSNVIIPITAEVPFTLAIGQLLAAANTSKITGGSEPTLTNIASVVIGNYSGQTANYLFCTVD